MLVFNVKDKSTYIQLTKDNIGNSKVYNKFKDIFESKISGITRYLCTIFASYEICKKLYDKKFNIKLNRHCPLFKYEPINTENDDNVEFIEAGSVYSFYDYYENSPIFKKNEYPAYSLNYILKNYVEDILDIEVNWEILKSPCTKNTFLVKVFDKDGDYEYIRNKDNINEFIDNEEGIKDAAFRIFLFYNKYI